MMMLRKSISPLRCSRIGNLDGIYKIAASNINKNEAKVTNKGNLANSLYKVFLVFVIVIPS